MELKDLKDKGFSPQTAYDRFEKAGMLKEYRSIYNMVCSHSHNNLRSLIDRHIKIQGDKFSVQFFKYSDLSYLIYSLSETIIGASCKIHKLLNMGSLADLNKLWDEWTNLIQEISKKDKA